MPGWTESVDHSAAADQLVSIDVATGAIATSVPLPGRGVYHALALGPRSGDLYLFGNRPQPGVQPPHGAPPRTQPEDVVVTVVAPGSGTARTTWAAGRNDGYDWAVYQGAVSPDEQAVYVSYHGTDTTGIDRSALTPTGLRRCRSSNPPNFGCIRSHGGFALYDQGLLAATGGPVIVETDRAGVVQHAVDTRLEHNHLMEFAVDAAARRLYAVGPCDYAGGYSAVDLRRAGVVAPGASPGTWPWQTSPAPPLVLIPPGLGGVPAGLPCGDRVTLGPGPVLVVASSSRRLLVLDPTTGTVRRTINVPADAVDVLAIAPP